MVRAVAMGTKMRELVSAFGFKTIIHCKISQFYASIDIYILLLFNRLFKKLYFRRNISQPVEGRPTNNMAEIQAVTVAARQAKKAGIKKLKINTDSKFLISCITQWMPSWKKRGWRTIDNKPVINKRELLEMEKELESLTIAWVNNLYFNILLRVKFKNL